MDTQTLTIKDALDSFEGGNFTSQDLAEACFDQINRLNPTLNAYITVIPPQDALNAQQPPMNTAPLNHALRGIPIAVKDLFNTAGILTTVGSKFFADNVPDEDAFVVERLKQAGALINGKTNTHEIALGLTGNNPHYGTARNPWNTERIPGGSSSGSAIAVATGMALGALGTDTGGSIRVPSLVMWNCRLQTHAWTCQHTRCIPPLMESRSRGTSHQVCTRCRDHASSHLCV